MKNHTHPLAHVAPQPHQTSPTSQSQRSQQTSIAPRPTSGCRTTKPRYHRPWYPWPLRRRRSFLPWHRLEFLGETAEGVVWEMLGLRGKRLSLSSFLLGRCDGWPPVPRLAIVKGCLKKQRMRTTHARYIVPLSSSLTVKENTSKIQDSSNQNKSVKPINPFVPWQGAV